MPKTCYPGFLVKLPGVGEVGLSFRRHQSAHNNQFSLIYISDSDSDIPIFSLCVIILLRAHKNPQEDSYTSAEFENWRFCLEIVCGERFHPVLIPTFDTALSRSYQHIARPSRHYPMLFSRLIPTLSGHYPNFIPIKTWQSKADVTYDSFQSKVY